MTDPKQLYSDFKRFITRLKRKYKSKTTIDYISVVEPQSRGAWHAHVLLRFNDVKKIYLSNNLVRELWEQGKIVSTKSLKDVDNIGAYLSAYLTDIEVPEDITLDNSHLVVETKKVDGKEKRFVKGGRLHMYPPGMNLYRKSKGIKPPERKEMCYEDIKKIVGSTKPHYEKSYHIENEDFTNTITYEQYNLKRL